MKQESGGVGTGEQLYCCEHESNQGQRENASGRVTHSKNGKAGRTLTVTEQGGHELLKRINQEAGDASEGLVSCTYSANLCCPHTSAISGDQAVSKWFWPRPSLHVLLLWGL